MFRGFGSTSEDNFNMGMQNGSKNDVWPKIFLINTLELQLWSFEVLEDHHNIMFV